MWVCGYLDVEVLSCGLWTCGHVDIMSTCPQMRELVARRKVVRWNLWKDIGDKSDGKTAALY